MAGLPPLDEILEEYRLVDAEDRYRLLIDLGRQLEPMPEALKTDATKVRGCSASVWVYPTVDQGRLHFLADSNAAITKGIVALILSVVQDKPAAEVSLLDVAERLAPFELRKHLSANRTQGVPNMIALVKQTADRYAAAT
jgi:cysteine desulfuration protein SufE